MSPASDDDKLPARQWLAHWLSDQSFWEGVVSSVLSTGIVAGVAALIAYFTAQDAAIRAVGLAIGAAAIGICVGLVVFSILGRRIAQSRSISVPKDADAANQGALRRSRAAYGVTAIVSVLVGIAGIVGAIYGLGLLR
jgi:hypothetical protein